MLLLRSVRIESDARITRYRGVLKAKRGAALAACLALCLGALPSWPAGAQGYTLGETIVADPVTGAALLGYDAVSFFLAPRPLAGSPERQVLYAGKAWHFASEGNRAAFMAAPERYLPAFGGHDPLAVARGAAVAGSPEFPLVIEGKVHLFRSDANRRTYASNAALHAVAATNWPELRHHLVP